MTPDWDDEVGPAYGCAAVLILMIALLIGGALAYLAIWIAGLA